MQVLFFALSCLTFSSTLQRLSAFLWQTGDVKASIIDSIAKVASGVEKVLLKPIVVAPASLPLPQHLDIVITKKTAEFKSLQCYQHGPPLPSNSAYRTREWSRYNAFLLSRAKLSYILFPADRDRVICTRCFGVYKRQNRGHSNKKKHVNRCKGHDADVKKTALVAELRSALLGDVDYNTLVDDDIDKALQLCDASQVSFIQTTLLNRSMNSQ